jgi:hypothetical protein
VSDIGPGPLDSSTDFLSVSNTGAKAPKSARLALKPDLLADFAQVFAIKPGYGDSPRYAMTR